MKQALALKIMLSGESVFLTGAAGSGKTHVLADFISLARAQGKTVSVTASTGLAATHLGGNTIHAWGGIGIHDYLSNNFFDQLSQARRQIITKTDILIIDEISMLHDFRLTMIDQICREVRQKLDQPFGGLQLILSGDFFQLPPVNRRTALQGNFAFMSPAWQELNPTICYLDEQFRQTDQELKQILNALRAGDLRRHHAEQLLERTKIEPPEDQSISELYTTNFDVDSFNQTKLKQLAGDEVDFTSSTTGAKNYVDNLQRSILAPAVLTLKKGAFVMAIKNSLQKKFANGSLGEVIDFEPYTNYPIVQFKNGQEVILQPETWELRDGDKKRASVTQIPLRLAWAITIHKSQGMTLDAARIDLGKSFVEGMGYVALSRVRTLDQLYLSAINQMALKVSTEAQAADNHFKQQSAQATKDFEYLNEQPAQKILPPTKKTGDSNSWQQKLAKMRLEHPNAYRPWTAQQDNLLRQEFQLGTDIDKLAQQLGRHQRSIVLRLQKLFGSDVVL